MHPDKDARGCAEIIEPKVPSSGWRPLRRCAGELPTGAIHLGLDEVTEVPEGIDTCVASSGR
jgi:hypothetical protein